MVDEIARGFVELGWQVSLLCAGPVGPRPYTVVENGGRYSQYLRAPFVWHRLRRADVVIDVSNGIPFFSSLWQRRPTICVMHHVHDRQWNDVFPAPVAVIGRFIERRVVPRVYRRFWSISPSTTQALRGLGIDPERIREVTSGIDVDVLRPEPGDKSVAPLFLVISRLVAHKGIDRVLRAWREVGAQTGGELVVIGDGPLLGELQAMGTPATTFLGFVSNEVKEDYLTRCWTLVHGAHHEGWGIVIMEAAGRGTPTLAFDASGVRDAVVDGSTGLLARDHDRFVASWLQLAQDDELREELGHKAWERASAMSWASAVQAVAGLVEDAADGSW